MNLEFVDGNCVEAEYSRPTILVHCTNVSGVMGAGIARAIAKKWPAVEEQYIKECEKGIQQGQIQIVGTDQKGLYICNLFGQSGIGDFEGLPAVRYGALEEGFLRLRKRLLANHNKNKSMAKRQFE